MVQNAVQSQIPVPDPATWPGDMETIFRSTCRAIEICRQQAQAIAPARTDPHAVDPGLVADFETIILWNLDTRDHLHHLCGYTVARLVAIDREEAACVLNSPPYANGLGLGLLSCADGQNLPPALPDSPPHRYGEGPGEGF